MPSRPLHVAFLWHQHQPYYKLGNSYMLPWARLHATKDYYDIIATLQRFPDIRQTVNVVPSLLIQLIDYVENGATDTALDLSRRPASELTEDEKQAILRSFFLCNVERMVLPYTRYAQLYTRAGGERNDEGHRTAVAEFTEEDWRDLQVWYNLTWIGEYSREKEPFKGLFSKGAGYTEQEKHTLLDASLQIIAAVIPLYKELMNSGQIELSVTPFYHPILPVLCDSYSALEAMPNATLPHEYIDFADDANEHISRAVALYRHYFGKEPRGMWPSEGSVSDQALNLIRSNDMEWAATDEGILKKSLGEGWHDLAKYFPYTLKTRSGPLWMLFRDHALSDAIGFVYSNWNPQDAAQDFYYRLIEIRNRIIQEKGADALEHAVVPIILDGENCWEYYEQNGRSFLEAFYQLLTESSEIQTTTISKALAGRTHKPARTLGRIYSGSWIGSNFKIWIGHDEDNRAWDALARARRELMEMRQELPKETFLEAMEEIYIAEGSDWFWWFGDEHTSANQDDFDEIFRSHLKNVYRIIGKEYPVTLDQPIRTQQYTPRVVPPTGAISPTIDGLRFPDDEWAESGYFIVENVGGAMHRADAFERQIRFGHDTEAFYIRFDTPGPIEEGEEVKLTLAGERGVTLRFRRNSVAIESMTDEQGRVTIVGISAAVAEIAEAAIPLKHLAPNGTQLKSVGIVCELSEHGHQTERFPHQGSVDCPVG